MVHRPLVCYYLFIFRHTETFLTVVCSERKYFARLCSQTLREQFLSFLTEDFFQTGGIHFLRVDIGEFFCTFSVYHKEAVIKQNLYLDIIQM